MLKISNNVSIPEDEIKIKAIRSQGSGGQNVNKVSTAAHLFFDIQASSLPNIYKDRLLKLKDARITSDGIIIIKAQERRSQEANKEDAINRLVALIRSTTVIPKKRRSTKPTPGSQKRRLDHKTKHSKNKALRRKIAE